jgi:hypothetical protein
VWSTHLSSVILQRVIDCTEALLPRCRCSEAGFVAGFRPLLCLLATDVNMAEGAVSIDAATFGRRLKQLYDHWKVCSHFQCIPRI